MHRNKNFSSFGPFLSYEENKLLNAVPVVPFKGLATGLSCKYWSRMKILGRDKQTIRDSDEVFSWLLRISVQCYKTFCALICTLLDFGKAFPRSNM
jgi:hypothetical protein